MKKWMVITKSADFNAISNRFNISPMLARILRNREVTGDDNIEMFLNGTPDTLHDPHLMKDMDKAAKLLSDAIVNQKKILIIGDYDIDGVCSSYILKRGIMKCGGSADVRLPDRIIDGYGMNMTMVDEAERGGYDFIITCDNGISASQEIEYAKSKGITVVVTDHHEVPYEEDDNNVRHFKLPKADAVVDPKQDDCAYPFKGLCGGAVVYKLMQVMKESFEPLEEIMNELLMFAAFATVGDVMPLVDENHIIVKYGIEEMKQTDNKGMNALIDVTGIDRTKISPYHIGFVLGPCVNATGRLSTAKNALDLFLAYDAGQASQQANELKSLNDSRKDLTESYLEAAINEIEGNERLKNANVLVVYLKDCHESLAGIIAGRIREKYYKPTFVFTKAEKGVKGSGRSIDDYNMYEELNKCSHLLTKYGGHKLAAGLSLEEDNLDNLFNLLNDNENLTEEELTEKIRIDIPMPISYATLDFAKELERLAPYGNGNTSPLFAEKNLKILNMRILGAKGKALKLSLEENGSLGKIVKEAIMFGDANSIMTELQEKDAIDIVYSIKVNSFRGMDSVQLEIKDYK